MYSLSSVLPQWTGFASRNEGGIVSEERKQVIGTQKEKGERVWGEKLTCKDSFPSGDCSPCFQHIILYSYLSFALCNPLVKYDLVQRAEVF